MTKINNQKSNIGIIFFKEKIFKFERRTLLNTNREKRVNL